VGAMTVLRLVALALVVVQALLLLDIQPKEK
jgi:hypothetical protein